MLGYLTSTRHLVGAALALTGLVAHFLGFLNAFWLPIVLGLYILGVLITPKTRADLQLERLADQSELRAELRTFLSRLRGKVPPDVYGQTERLVGTLEELLPRLHELEERGDHNALVIRQLITDYLPATFSNYLKLSRPYAQGHRLEDGRTPQEVLVSQLALLDLTLQEVASHVYRGETDGLLANGQFLQEKFGQPDLKL